MVIYKYKIYTNIKTKRKIYISFLEFKRLLQEHFEDMTREEINILNKEDDDLDLIFTNGEKLYKKEKKRQEMFIKTIKKTCSLNTNQEQILTSYYTNKDFNVYGDDFKIEIIPRNVVGDCALSIKDYDENQHIEEGIVISFNKDELKQFINLLQIIESKMQ